MVPVKTVVAFCSTLSVVRRGGSLRATKEVVVGLGCFWEPSERLLEVPGVIDTACGYAGGPEERKPSYDSVCFGDGNVEAVRVQFDDEIVSLEAVLDAAAACAKPAAKRQYSPIVFVSTRTDAERLRPWRESHPAFATELASRFWLAEDYHQRYWQRTRPRFAILALAAVLQTVPDDRFSTVCSLVIMFLALQLAYERVFTRVEDFPIGPIS